MNRAKELIDKAIVEYKKALEKLEKKDNDEIKKIRRKIEENIDNMLKAKIKIDNLIARNESGEK